MLVISQEEFEQIVRFVYQNFGIDLSKKKQLIEGRLYAPFSASGYQNFSDYLNSLLKSGKSDDMEMLLNRLTTNHSYFMRESSHFDLFRDTILPTLERTKKDKVLGIWSAGCSTGQEPYTLSMILKDYFANKPGWNTRVLATDISMRAMDIAKKATYKAEDVLDIPKPWREKYFHNNADGTVTIDRSIVDNVIYRAFNLMDPIQFKIKFDVIFCRNVMIYFDQQTRDALVRRFYNATADGGYLLVGHSETLNKATTEYISIDTAAYVKKPR